MAYITYPYPSPERVCEPLPWEWGQEPFFIVQNPSILPSDCCHIKVFSKLLLLFQEHRVKPIIQHVLETNLAEQKYDPDFCKDAALKITEEIKERVKKLCYPRYKFVCHVVIGDINQQDVKIVSRCAWDSAVDRFAQYQYRNYHLYAVGVVYGIYCE